MAEIDFSCKREQSGSARTQRILDRIHDVNTANEDKNTKNLARTCHVPDQRGSESQVQTPDHVHHVSYLTRKILTKTSKYFIVQAGNMEI